MIEGRQLPVFLFECLRQVDAMQFRKFTQFTQFTSNLGNFLTIPSNALRNKQNQMDPNESPPPPMHLAPPGMEGVIPPPPPPRGYVGKFPPPPPFKPAAGLPVSLPPPPPHPQLVQTPSIAEVGELPEGPPPGAEDYTEDPAAVAQEYDVDPTALPTSFGPGGHNPYAQEERTLTTNLHSTRI